MVEELKLFENGKLTDLGRGGIVVLVILALILIIWRVRRRNGGEEPVEAEIPTMARDIYFDRIGDIIGTTEKQESITTESKKIFSQLIKKRDYLSKDFLEDKGVTEKKLNEILKTQDEMMSIFNNLKKIYAELEIMKEILERRLTLYK